MKNSSAAGLSASETARQRLLALRLAGKARSGAAGASSIRRRADPRQARLSSAQLGFWFVEQLRPGTSSFHIPALLRLSGRLNISALEQALHDVVARHEILRTRFAVGASGPIQVIEDINDKPLQIVEVPYPDDAAQLRLQRAKQMAVEDAFAPFELTMQAPLRVRLYACSPDESLLLVCMHHIICDEISLTIFIQEVTAAYHLRSRGLEPQSAPAAIQFGDYAEWQRERAEGPLLRDRTAYWRSKLEDAPIGFGLPNDHQARPSSQARAGDLSFGLDPLLSKSIRELARTCHTSVFLILLAALKATLYRCTGEPDLLLTTAVADRQATNAQLIGCLINVIVLRNVLSDDPTFNVWARRVRQTYDEAIVNEIPFDILVRELAFDRSAAQEPFSRVMFAYLSAVAQTQSVSGLRVEPIPLEARAIHQDLLIHMWEEGGALKARLRFRSDLYRASTIRTLFQRFTHVLAALTQHPDLHISELPILSQDEWHRSIVEWNRTSQQFGPVESFNALFAARVASDPEGIALVQGEQFFSTAALDRQANRLAHVLRAKGLRPGQAAAICMHHGADLLIAILGVLKAGAAYVTIPPDIPEARIALIHDEVRASWLLTQQDRHASLRDLLGQAVIAVDDAGLTADAPTLPPDVEIAGTDLCYIVYTSGTTGVPKGIGITHAGIVNNLLDMQARYGLNADDAMLALSSLGFDVSVMETLLNLASGSRIILPTREEFRDPGAWARLIEDCGATVWCTAPALLKMLIDTADNESRDLTGIRLAMLAGEKLPLDLPEKARRHMPNARFANLGGAAEASVYSTVYDFERVDASWLAVPYGYPLANQTLHVVDRDLSLVPQGSIGELCIAGAGLGRGYHFRPGETASRFLPNPFGPPGSRLYATGDLVRRDQHGTLFISGRRDHQVKINGVRIEPDEIAAVLKSHPGIRDALVLADTAASGRSSLAAYLVLSDDVPARMEDLVLHVRSRLLPEMCPSRWFALPAIPLTKTDKIDIQRVRALGRELSADAGRNPSDALEAFLIGIWRDVLSRDDVGTDHNFFHVGGHSLIATQTAVRIREALGIALPLHLLFEFPTVRALASRLRQEYGKAVVEIAAAIMEIAHLDDAAAEEWLERLQAAR